MKNYIFCIFYQVNLTGGGFDKTGAEIVYKEQVLKKQVLSIKKYRKCPALELVIIHKDRGLLLEKVHIVVKMATLVYLGRILINDSYSKKIY